MTGFDIIKDQLGSSKRDRTNKGRQARSDMSKAEKAFWGMVSTKRIMNLKWRRIHHLRGTTTIAPFYCHQFRLVVKVVPVITEDMVVSATLLEDRSFYKTILFTDNQILETPDESIKRLRWLISQMTTC